MYADILVFPLLVARRCGPASKVMRILFGSLLVLHATLLPAAENKPSLIYEDADVYMRLVLRSPEQLSGFYQGREFPDKAVKAILDTCYVTPIIKNKRFDVLWLDLDQWKFIADKPVPRIKRDYWDQRWRELGLKQAHQSTFGWTLMPERRDLRVDESVGGAVVIPWQDKAFNLVARFPTGESRDGAVKEIQFKGVRCRENSPSS